MTRTWIWLYLLFAKGVSLAAEPVAIGSRRELFVDEALVAELSGKADLRLHQATPQNVGLTTDGPWEGNGTNYVTVFQDGDKYRMYYRGSHCSYLDGKDRPNTRDLYCYAESADGIHWTKPELGLFDWNGSKRNNIVWDGVGAHGFAPFCDTKPAVGISHSVHRPRLDRVVRAAGFAHARQLVLRRHVSELGLGRDQVGHRGRALRAVAVRDRTHTAGNGCRAPALQSAYGRYRLAARPVGGRRVASRLPEIR